MHSIEIRKGIQVTLDDLVNSLSKMDVSELKHFADKMNHLVDLRHDTTSNEAEKEVIKQINDIIPASVVRRFKQLRKKHSAGALTHKEQEEMVLLTDFMEEKSAERMFLIGLLAKKRNISVKELIKQFPLIKYE